MALRIDDTYDFEQQSVESSPNLKIGFRHFKIQNPIMIDQTAIDSTLQTMKSKEKFELQFKIYEDEIKRRDLKLKSVKAKRFKSNPGHTRERKLNLAASRQVVLNDASVSNIHEEDD